MGERTSRENLRAAFLKAAEKTYDELEDWYEQHPDASLGEVEGEIQRLLQETARKVMGEREEHKEDTE